MVNEAMKPSKPKLHFHTKRKDVNTKTALNIRGVIVLSDTIYHLVYYY